MMVDVEEAPMPVLKNPPGLGTFMPTKPNLLGLSSWWPTEFAVSNKLLDSKS